MRTFIYLLTMTDRGSELAPAYEVNTTMVVVAVNSKAARLLASGAVIDESPETWLNGNYSTCRRLGEVIAGGNKQQRVVCQENNAS